MDRQPRHGALLQGLFHSTQGSLDGRPRGIHNQGLQLLHRHLQGTPKGTDHWTSYFHKMQVMHERTWHMTQIVQITQVAFVLSQPATEIQPLANWSMQMNMTCSWQIRMYKSECPGLALLPPKLVAPHLCQSTFSWNCVAAPHPRFPYCLQRCQARGSPLLKPPEEWLRQDMQGHSNSLEQPATDKEIS